MQIESGLESVIMLGAPTTLVRLRLGSDYSFGIYLDLASLPAGARTSWNLFLAYEMLCAPPSDLYLFLLVLSWIYANRVPGYLIALGSPPSDIPAMAQAAGGAF